jgi:hypothetical protein
MPESPLASDEINKMADVIFAGRSIPEWSNLSDADKAAINAEVERLEEKGDKLLEFPAPNDVPDPTPDDVPATPKL